MKAKIVLCLLLLSHTVFAQNIQRQIENYTNKRADLILKSRALLLDKIVEGDMASAKQVVAFIKDSIESKGDVGLYNLEKILVYYHVGDYDNLLQKYKEVDSLGSFRTFGGRYLPQDDSFYETLLGYTIKSYDQLANGIDESVDILDENKAFLQLSLQFVLLHNDTDFTTQDDLNVLANRFLTEYPESDFNSFTRKWIRHEYEPSLYGGGFGLYLGGSFFNGFFGKQFTNPFLFGIELDGAAGHLIGNVNFTFGFNKTNGNINYTSKGRKYVWYSDAPSTYFLIKADIGYEVVDNKDIRIIPFLGFGGYNISSTEEDEYPELKDVSTSAFTFGPGVKFDFKFSGDKYHWFAFRIGYSYNMSQFKGSSSNFHTITFGIVDFGRKAVRKY